MKHVRVETSFGIENHWYPFLQEDDDPTPFAGRVERRGNEIRINLSLANPINPVQAGAIIEALLLATGKKP